jgi:hypothetical protein
MKSKTEIKLDKEFENLGIKPRVYHFTDIPLFNAVTVAIDNRKQASINSWEGVADYMRDCRIIVGREHNRATRFLEKMRRENFYGVAICDKRDQFNRQRGRIIAKGRLLKQLRKEANKE